MNAWLFSLLFGRSFSQSLKWAINEFKLEGYLFRLIESSDIQQLKSLIDRQETGRLTYFNPHKFDLQSLKRVNKNPSFFMMGVFRENQLVGYFFLRCFLNRKCFVGRLIDEPSEGKGIGRIMNKIMYNTAWHAKFRCLSTISKNNHAVMRSHANNEVMKILRELKNDYLLVEFINPLDGN
jgi:hypothetical protein